MKVHELIEKLKLLPQELEVMVADSDDWGTQYVDFEPTVKQVRHDPSHHWKFRYHDPLERLMEGDTLVEAVLIEP